MRDVSGQNFGYLIAFVIPGLGGLLCVGAVDPRAESWILNLAGIGTHSVSGGVFYITLAAMAAGLTASTVRWCLLDSIHHQTGVRRPVWNDARLQENLAAFEALVVAHYRYYQFYGNSLVVLISLLSWRVLVLHSPPCSVDNALLLALSVLYWAGSRDTLKRYYARAETLLGTPGGSRHDEWAPSTRRISKDQRRPRSRRAAEARKERRLHHRPSGYRRGGRNEQRHTLRSRADRPEKVSS